MAYISFNRLKLAFVFLISLTGCGMQGSSPSVPATSQAQQSSIEQSTAPLVYVSNSILRQGHWYSSLLGFASDANGNVPPVVKLRGRHTGMGQLRITDTSVAVDTLGRLYTTGPNLDAIGVWPAGSNGDAHFAAYFDVNCDDFSAEPIVFVLDKRGHIWAACFQGNNQHNEAQSAIFEFPPVPAGAKGHIALRPLREIAGSRTKLFEISAIALNGKGDVSVENVGSTILTFAGTANGNVAPLSIIAGPNTQLHGDWNPKVGYGGIWYNSQGRLVACSNSSQPRLLTFALGAHGNVAPTSSLFVDGCYGITLDPNDNIYVSFNNAIQVYAAGSAGSTKPVRTIRGGRTTLYWASSVTF